MSASLGCASRSSGSEAPSESVEVALASPRAKASPTTEAQASAEPIASVQARSGVMFAPGALAAAPPKLRAFLEACLKSYVDKELSAVVECFDPAYIKDQSHSPVRWIVLDSMGFFTLSHHVSGPRTNDDGLVWRQLSFVDVQGIEWGKDHWRLSGRAVAGDITYELHMIVYGDEAKGYLFRGPVG